ncbi:hypothetical protein [Stakelama saccharophila]|uniref:Porin n=1 Tax=Stakelama saccharophila TaxID=3075605 RepID=A0ABZ0B9R5_9SPHN|nr:hypothetical protein [Stakelama sp. W311]WNO54018.1 hypothetical protein RPR59_01795 [Stakelama sp. W311]
MPQARVIAGIGIGAFVVAGIAVAPAIHAQGSSGALAASVSEPRLGSFTPASADPKLAAVLAKSGIDTSDFRFTPSESSKSKSRSVTLAVQARTQRGKTAATETAAATAPGLTLAPIAYNLGVSVGWKRLAVSGDVSRLDLAGEPGSRESAEVGLSYTGEKVGGSVKAKATRPLEHSPAMIAENQSYSIDVGGSYKIAHNLDLTAGVRYKSEQNRLPRLADDNRRDSQAVYIGTAFRF